jgi:hypothetical protein
MVIFEGLCFVIVDREKTCLDIACALKLIRLNCGTLNLQDHCMKNVQAKHDLYLKKT